MFGNQNMQDMMAKLQEMQGAVEDSKKRLENISGHKTFWCPGEPRYHKSPQKRWPYNKHIPIKHLNQISIRALAMTHSKEKHTKMICAFYTYAKPSMYIKK